MTEFPQSDNYIEVHVGVHRPSLFIRCTREYFDSKIDQQILTSNFLKISDRQNSDQQLWLTHLNPQTPEYWEQLADWFREKLN